MHVIFDLNTYLGIALGAMAAYVYFSYTGSTLNFKKTKAAAPQSQG